MNYSCNFTADVRLSQCFSASESPANAENSANHLTQAFISAIITAEAHPHHGLDQIRRKEYYRMKKKLLIFAAILCLTAAGCTQQEQSSSDANASAAVSDTTYSSTQHETDSPDWVKALPAAQDENNRQLFIVAGMGMDKTTATISMHERDKNGNWKQILSTPGYVGKNGLCPDGDHAEGCGQTPIGTYRFNKAFGIADDPGCAIPYVKADDSTYWSGDQNEGMHYNEMVSIKDFPNLNVDDSEHITDYEYQYRYCLNISFNEDGTAGRGSAIFLHCLGPLKPFTGGCVAVPENIMKLIMQRVNPDCVVVIDTFENLNGSF